MLEVSGIRTLLDQLLGTSHCAEIGSQSVIAITGAKQCESELSFAFAKQGLPARILRINHQETIANYSNATRQSLFRFGQRPLGNKSPSDLSKQHSESFYRRCVCVSRCR